VPTLRRLNSESGVPAFELKGSDKTIEWRYNRFQFAAIQMQMPTSG